MTRIFIVLVGFMVFTQITFSQILESQTKIFQTTIKEDSSKGSISKVSDSGKVDISKSFVGTNDMPKWHSMITNLPTDWNTWGKKYISKDYLLPVVLIAVSTAALILTDDITYRESDKFYNRTQFNKSVSDFFTEFGDGRTQFILAGGFGLYGFVGSDNRALRTASQIVEAVLSSGAVVQVLKHVTGRESPFVRTETLGRWRFFPNQIEYHKHVPHYDAFPSGHICTSVATFVVIQENYPEQKWITPVSCALSGLICFGMANKGIHWYSDYPLGIAIGYTFGKLISAGSVLHKEENGVGLSISPSFGPDEVNMRLSYNF